MQNKFNDCFIICAGRQNFPQKSYLLKSIINYVGELLYREMVFLHGCTTALRSVGSTAVLTEIQPPLHADCRIIISYLANFPNPSRGHLASTAFLTKLLQNSPLASHYSICTLKVSQQMLRSREFHKILRNAEL